MAWFPDLSPYSYGHSKHPGVVHVGWLDGIHPYSKGPVAPPLIGKMTRLAAHPVELYRGFHICEICIAPSGMAKTLVPDKGRMIDPNCSWMRWAEQRRGNGEIRVSYKSITFAAPILIVHYIEEHEYRPPAQFLEAIGRVDL
jgi:hypothetical protein